MLENEMIQWMRPSHSLLHPSCYVYRSAGGGKKLLNPPRHRSRCCQLTLCRYSHHSCWSGWHQRRVVFAVCQSGCLLSAHWLTKATDSSGPKGFIQTDVLRNCIHQQRVGGEVMNSPCPQLKTTAICCFEYFSCYVSIQYWYCKIT